MSNTVAAFDELHYWPYTSTEDLNDRVEGIDLPVLVEGDPILFNPYGIIAVNPEVHPHVNFDLAMSFINWFTSVPTQKVIGEFGEDKFDQPLFVPDSEEWRAAQ